MPKVSLLAVLASLTIGCGVDLPPTVPTPMPAHGAPSKIELNATSGMGANGGHATVTARVLDAYALLLPDVSVTFGATAGTLSAATVPTNSNGIATTTLTADPGTVKITAAAGGVSAPEAQVTIQPVNVFTPPPPGPTPPPEPPPPPTPPPPTPHPFYQVAVAATPASVVTGTPTTLTATVTPFNGAPPASSATWLWDCDTATAATDGATPNSAPCTYSTASTFTAKVTVTSGTATGSATTTVTVTAAPVIPFFVSVTAAPPGPVATGLPVVFTATLSSTAPLPTHLQFDWDDQNDGVVDATTASATRTLTVVAAGTTSVIWKTSVKVTDLDTGRTATGVGQLTVTP